MKQNQRGSIAILVLVSILFFVVILMSIFFVTSSMKRTQLNGEIGIRKVYGDSVNQVDQVYEEVIRQKGVANSPDQIDGLTPIKFTDPTENAMGSYETTNWNDSTWYDYDHQKWANAISADGSMWVWIPRYAYQIKYTNSSDKAAGGTVSVHFLKDTTDNYYDEKGNIQTAKRCTTESMEIDTTTGYTVHPAFTNESDINFRNGGWDKELRGIWVAKFEAGYAQGNNSTPVVASNINYTQDSGWVTGTEAGVAEDGTQIARNWLDGIYGTTTTSIKYPVFQPVTYSMNYIGVNDASRISTHLTDNGNSYGFNSSNTDSHLMKNSEWGAIVYLSQSQYGLNGAEMAVNNINLNSGGVKRTNTAGKNGVDSVYAVTGCTTGKTGVGDQITQITTINAVTGNTPDPNGVYIWKQLGGTKASTTGNITGIYDMAGGISERIASYVNNGSPNIGAYGASLATSSGKSTKYVTIYPHDGIKDNSSITEEDANRKAASIANYTKNIKIYGDAIKESSTSGTGNTSWYKNNSEFVGLYYPFIIRGGGIQEGTSNGPFSFWGANGDSSFRRGFRSVLIAK